jgi:hypothetical protein
MTIILLAMIVQPAVAQEAGTFIDYPTPILEAVPGTWMENGVGAPTVVWDEVSSRYLMIFETRLPETDPFCPVGIWGLGLATSTDGVNWSPLPSPLLEPQVGTFYSCVAAHPSAVFDATRNSLYVFYKAERDTDCEDCSRYTGVGRLMVRFDAGGSVIGAPSVLPSPVLPLDTPMGFPRFVATSTENILLYAQDGAIHRATSSRLRSFVPDLAPVIEPGFADWAEDEVLNPTVACDGSEIVMYVGGRDLDGWALLNAGWGRATSEDGAIWNTELDTYFEWSDDNSWRHWEVLPLTTGDHLIVGSEKNEVTGVPHITLSGTTMSWSGDDIIPRVCELAP